MNKIDSKKALKIYVDDRIFSQLDYYSAELLAKEDCALFLLVLLVSRAYRYGHIVLPIDYLKNSLGWFHEENIENRSAVIEALLAYADIQSSKDWDVVLNRVSAPIIRTDRGIYLEKQYQHETQLVTFIKEQIEAIDYNETEMTLIKEALNEYFHRSTDEIDWQKVAAANTLLQKISIISGGPGTGKTTTVFNILLILRTLEQANQANKSDGKDQIKGRYILTAPTGKAAARLTESINQQKSARLDAGLIDAALVESISSDSLTLHRLLGIHPITKVPRYNRDNPLTLDLLVIDEASMIDVSMFIKVIDALPTHARLILLGDRDQLSSVEAGSIMYELCKTDHYSDQNRLAIEALIDQKLPNHNDFESETSITSSSSRSFDYLSVLKKSYRFDDHSSLGLMAKLINSDYYHGKTKKLITLIDESKDRSVARYLLPLEKDDLQRLILDSFADYMVVLNDPISSPETIFNAFNAVRYLSVQRRGEYGTNRLNELIAATLFPQHEQYFYHGLAVMIEENDYEYGLFNGDIGLILERDGLMRAYFELEEGIQDFSIHSLPRYDHAFAMTVHKSQGSEFNHVLLFLAEYRSAFLTKELFYTGVTRAKERVTLFSANDALDSALKQRTNRFSFIHDRLTQAVS